MHLEPGRVYTIFDFFNGSVCTPVNKMIDSVNDSKTVETPKIKINRPTPEEDHAILEEVAKYKPENGGRILWTLISKHFNNKFSEKQLRDRWRRKLKYIYPYNVPSKYNQKAWTTAEDNIIMEKVSEIGKQWDKIQFFIPDRTVCAIKARWFSHLRHLTARRGYSCNFSRDSFSTPAVSDDQTSIFDYFDRDNDWDQWH